MESFANSNKKLRKLGNLKGKLSNKVSNITKEHKFFSDNVTYPTCTQSIEESFRLNKINEAESKAKELKKGYEELSLPSNSKKIESKLLKNYPRKLTKLTMKFLKPIQGFLDLKINLETSNKKFKQLPNNLKNRTAEKHALETLLSQLEDLQKNNLNLKKRMLTTSLHIL